MSKVTNSPEQSKTQAADRLSNPLSLLTSQRTLLWWIAELDEKAWQIRQRQKPGRKIKRSDFDDLVLYDTLLELVEHLAEWQKFNEHPEVFNTLEGYRALIAEYKQERDQAIETANKAVKVCEDWMEMAQEDAPASNYFLNPANLAMRLQRPHKSN